MRRRTEASPERSGGDVVHQLGERQRVGGGPAAAAHRLQRQDRRARGADLAGSSAVKEQLSSQREGNGHLEVKCIIPSAPPPSNSSLQKIQKANFVSHPLSSTTQMIDSIKDSL